MKAHDTVDFAIVDVSELRAAHAAQEAVRNPTRHVLPNGDVLESLNNSTGTYKITDMAGNTKGYTHAERVEYFPTLTEQFLASKGA